MRKDNLWFPQLQEIVNSPFSSWNGYGDELAWAAAWLAKATGESHYLTTAEALFDEFSLCSMPTEFSWDNKVAGVQILMFELTGDAKYKACVDSFMNYLLYQAQYTPKGLIFIQEWGSLRHASNVAHACAQVAL